MTKKDKIWKDFPSLKNIKEYIDVGGNFCPYCNSNDVEYGSSEFGKTYVSQSVSCSNCDKMWDDIYELHAFASDDALYSDEHPGYINDLQVAKRFVNRYSSEELTRIENLLKVLCPKTS